MISVVFKWLVTMLISFTHPYFVSLTEIQHNKASKTLEVSVRIFTDDLEKTIRNTYKGKVDLLDKNQKPQSEKLIQQYITKHLALTADGKNVRMNFVGFEAEEGSIWSYFECRDISMINILHVDNTILYDYRKQQVNFVHVKANNSDETIKLDYPDTYSSFTLK